MATKMAPAKKAPAKKTLVAKPPLKGGVKSLPRSPNDEGDDRLPIVREGPKK